VKKNGKNLSGVFFAKTIVPATLDFEELNSIVLLSFVAVSERGRNLTLKA